MGYAMADSIIVESIQRDRFSKVFKTMMRVIYDP